MKSAIIHYWLINMRGGERVVEELCRLLPEADIFTHACDPEKISGYLRSRHIQTTFIGRLPGAEKHCQYYLPLMFKALEKLDLSAYPLIVSSESGPAKGVKKAPGAKHICYCHTPMRYLYDMYDEYYANAGLAGKCAMRLFSDAMRRRDARSAEGVDVFVANSSFVRERIKRIYHRDAEVVNPPVEVDFFRPRPEEKIEKQDYYLFVGELTGYKRPELALQSCLELKRPLVIVGDGPEKKRLQRLAGNNEFIQFAGRAGREELRKYYLEARGLLFPGVEDFGIVPVEAMAAGCPVAAYGAGGAAESVNDDCGIFFYDPDARSLKKAMLELEKRNFSASKMLERASRFSPEVFRNRMKRIIGL